MARIVNFSDGFESSSVPETVILPAGLVSVTPSGNLASTDAQSALVELQTDIDTRATTSAMTAGDVATLASAETYVDVALAALVGSTPATLDTLDELANALGDDPNFATTVSTSLGNRLRVDTDAQGLNGTQKTNAKTNIDLHNVDNTSDATKNAATATLTNKTINGSNNTITNVSLTTGVTGTLPLANGGTGQTSKAAAFDALSPMTTSGDIIYGGASGTGTRLAKGSNGDVLTLASGVPSWAAPSASGTAVVAIYALAGAVATSTTAPINFATQKTDTTGTLVTTGSSWKFTAPSTGYYFVTATVAPASSGCDLFLYKNGVSTGLILCSMNASSLNNGSVGIALSATDYIDLRFNVSQNTNSSTNQSVTIYKIA